MASPLTIPGVQVQTQFEPSPPIPGATGILGVVGVTDRGPNDPTPAGSAAEFLQLFGAGSRYTLPEVRSAFANGVAQVVIVRTLPGLGQKAALDLEDEDGERVVRLEARAEGAWGNRIGVRVIPVRTLSGQGVKYVNMDILLHGEVIERHNSLVMDPYSPDYLFERLNDRSALVSAFDPLFEKNLPAAVTRTPFVAADARAAFGTLKAGTGDVIQLEARRAGPAGNRVSIVVADGRAGLTLEDSSGAPSVDLRAREPGADGTQFRVTVRADSASTASIIVTRGSGAPRTIGPFDSVDALVDAAVADPEIEVIKLGNTLPAAHGPAPLRRRIDLSVVSEGQDPRVYPGLADLAAIAATNDPAVRFTSVAGQTTLPDATDGVPLTGGRGRGAALALTGDDEMAGPILELVPTDGGSDIAIAVARGISSIDQLTPVASISVFLGGDTVETFQDLTMDPDDPRYLPQVLETSAFVRAFDLFVRSRATALPRAVGRPAELAGGVSPAPDDYVGALERLESAEEVDLVIASVANQLDDDGVRTVHQAVVAHCAKMADVARNRIGIGSVTQAETSSAQAILDHADDVRSDHFILTAPAGMEAAVAGLLGRQSYFESPTFKPIASPGVPAGAYSDAQLAQLVNGNVAVVNERRRLGIIVVKGLLTSGRQINVQRTANKAVRDVKAIAQKFIGLLNNEGDRNALRQQITALLLQMERDGALVPSTDGADPAFQVAVYSTPDDFAKGIVRVDIAVRPVRAIDYIYATIFVRN